jgi:[acyl-carrier-protein] S-malonyltransferase
MKTAHVFAGQGAQFPGMGKELYFSNYKAAKVFDLADELLGFKISKVMFEGSDEELKETAVTQPSLFIHALATHTALSTSLPDAVAGHSLGELSALVAAKVLTFEDGLELVKTRANAMQQACEAAPGTMAAILGLDNEVVEETCSEIDGIVVAANYNCPGQLVISGDLDAVSKACELLTSKGARRALLLPVGGAFHSPLMAPAKEELETKINALHFKDAIFPVYQNITGLPARESHVIKINLIAQLTGPVKWTQTIQNMISAGIMNFSEFGGNGKVLSGLIKKVSREATIIPI